MSSFFGLGLAALEAPEEIELNDLRLSNSYRLEAVERSSRKIISLAPTLCLRIYLENIHNFTNSSGYELEIIDILGHASESHYELAAAVDAITQLFEVEYEASIDLVDNLTDAFLFLDQCGQNVSTLVDDLQTPNASVILGNATGDDSEHLSLNWNRCANVTNSTFGILSTRYHPVRIISQK